MKLDRTYSLEEIASLLDAKPLGDFDVKISGINEIHRVEEGDIAFVDHPKYYDKVLNSKASVVLIDKEVKAPAGKAIIVSDNPFKSFNFLLNYFYPFEFPEKSDEFELGEGSKIHPSAVIGKNVKIGKNTLIYPNVTILDNVIIGDNVIIQAGSVIGSFGFYYKNRGSHFERLYSCGRVIIENKVEIGANCTIDKGVSADTIIGENTIIDNLVQIGHDTVIGKNCLIAAQCGIAGCVNIGDKVTIWGQVGMASSVTIGDGAIIHAQTGVAKSLAGGKTYFGSPADESRNKLKEMAALRNLHKILEQKNM